MAFLAGLKKEAICCTLMARGKANGYGRQLVQHKTSIENKLDGKHFKKKKNIDAPGLDFP